MLTSPRPLPPNTAWTSNPMPSSAMVISSAPGSPASLTVTFDARLYFAAFCNAFLGDAEEAEREVGWQSRRHVLVREGHGQTRMRHLRLQSLQGADQADQAQLGRMEPAREIVDAARHAVRPRQDLVHRLRPGPDAVCPSSSRSISSSASCWLMSS